MIRIDTHAAIWLFMNQLDEFTPGGRRIIGTEDLVISPIVELELTVLNEVGKFAHAGSEAVDALVVSLGAKRSPVSLSSLVHTAHALDWTRDPFDRMITADAIAANCPLLTSDRIIRENCELATW